jgi:hypothetical protein
VLTGYIKENSRNGHDKLRRTGKWELPDRSESDTNIGGDGGENVRFSLVESGAEWTKNFNWAVRWQSIKASRQYSRISGSLVFNHSSEISILLLSIIFKK